MDGSFRFAPDSISFPAFCLNIQNINKNNSQKLWLFLTIIQLYVESSFLAECFLILKRNIHHSASLFRLQKEWHSLCYVYFQLSTIVSHHSLSLGLSTDRNNACATGHGVLWLRDTYTFRSFSSMPFMVSMARFAASCVSKCTKP